MAMEISGGILQRVPHFSGRGAKAQRGGSSSPSMKISRVHVRRFCFPSGGFEDNGHAEYYDHGRVKCEGKKGKEVEKGVLISSLKKKKKELKLLKVLSKDLSLFSEMGFEESQGKVISEAAVLLMKQSEQMRAEEKELKRQRKEEKAKLKAMQNSDSESSSSSSSSESDCDEVINVRTLKNKPLDQAREAETRSISNEEVAQTVLPRSSDTVLLAPHKSIPAIPSLPPPLEANTIQIQINSSEFCDSHKLEEQFCSAYKVNSNSSNIEEETLTTSAKRIEVCMGGKCKKSGAAELLEEFERVVGVEGAVVGCKCMGKCKDGPNVRVSSCSGDKDKAAVAVDKSTRRSSNLPLCIGVGLEDVGLIVTKFLGGDGNNTSFAGATSM